jgi:hypothetical protein
MNDDEYVVIVNSGASRNLFPDNTAASFRTKLCETVVLKPVSTHWECALTVAHIPANYYNINDYCRTIVVKKSKHSKEEVRSRYSRSRYGFHDYTVPHSYDHFTAVSFVKYVNDAMHVHNHVHFRLELSNRAIERKRYSSSAEPPPGEDENEPLFVFHLGKNAKFQLLADGMGFWTSFINLDPSLIGREIVQTFTVPVKEKDINVPFIRITTPFVIRVFIKSGDDVITSIIPRIFPDDTLTSIQIPNGNYRNEKILIQQIASSVDEHVVEKTQSDQQKREIFRFNHNSDNTISIEILHDRYAFQFTDDLAYALGFQKDHWYDKSMNKGLLPIDLHYNLNTIYVYTDVVSNSILSNVRAPMITMLPVKQRPTDRTVPYQPPRVHYYPVSKTAFSEISISMAGDFGKIVPFVPGVESTIKLHFRIYKR